ncbi:hypothetical protein [Erwinia phage Snitter]|nr:hypothetical protein [Erwinia phage Snitter]
MAKSKITDEQFLAERAQGKTLRQIAEEYSLHIRSVEARSAKLARKGYGHGKSDTPSQYAPEGFSIKGTSTLIGKDGQMKTQWIKSEVDKEKQLELLRIAITALCDDITPCEIVPLRREGLSEKLLNLYTVSDYHLGMLSWEEESGDDWDMKIAKDLFYSWFKAAIDTSPPAEHGVINLLGDFAHFDSLDAVTPASGHVLDADTRYQKLVRYMIQMIAEVVKMALEKHEKVTLMIVQGNHDETGMIWLAEMFNFFFSSNDRVTVDTQADVYKQLTHGKTALFFHHGHKANMGKLDSVLVGKFRKEYGAAEYHYAHCGHLHHMKMIESNLMVIEQHRTLAAKDAYASRGGWLSNRSANVITYSKEYGEVSRLTISPEMLK